MHLVRHDEVGKEDGVGARGENKDSQDESLSATGAAWDSSHAWISISLQPLIQINDLTWTYASVNWEY